MSGPGKDTQTSIDAQIARALANGGVADSIGTGVSEIEEKRRAQQAQIKAKAEAIARAKAAKARSMGSTGPSPTASRGSSGAPFRASSGAGFATTAVRFDPERDREERLNALSNAPIGASAGGTPAAASTSIAASAPAAAASAASAASAATAAPAAPSTENAAASAIPSHASPAASTTTAIPSTAPAAAASAATAAPAAPSTASAAASAVASSAAAAPTASPSARTAAATTAVIFNDPNVYNPDLDERSRVSVQDHKADDKDRLAALALQKEFNDEERRKQERLKLENAKSAAFLAQYQRERSKAREPKHSEEDDASMAYAHKLQEEEREAERLRRRKAQEIANADAAASFALQNGEQSYLSITIPAEQFFAASERWNAKKPKRDPRKHKNEKDYTDELAAFERTKEEALELLKTVLKHPSVAGEPGAKELMDAHKYTVSYIRPNLKPLLKLDVEHELSDPKHSAATVLSEVTKFLDMQLAERNKFPAGNNLSEAEMKKREAEKAENKKQYTAKMEKINTTFSKIKGYVIDQETEGHIEEFLSRNWSLAKLLGKPYDDGLLKCANFCPYKDAIASILNDNIADKGGCTAGLMARLFAVYVKFLVILLAPKLNNNPSEANNREASNRANAPASTEAVAPATTKVKPKPKPK